ncbi:sugar ABC transporter substrate-binding protein [Pseudoalteromonas rubra]|uniref:Sugar ABC transporter substrate-binding protein n=1 Tax=Pseudoalteromonas rubra TaxID=43658 RepID=A0A5S3WU59_9GAMM|nr:ABC transporter substrate-binding protein [Pseudoalteromonas rubra]TMP31760.1 sugar ABC transporter substrate-binding protein [Pseudoalteromonas rubra]TMP33157.1 sugar ABC transporter substrate-binding protein [Pseudoalteromonas rubra]
MERLIIPVATLFFVAFTIYAQPITVTFINPGHKQDNPTGAFWHNVSKVMDAAAEDLDIQLETLYAERNHIVMKKLAQQALLSSADYLVLVDEKGVITDALLTATGEHKRVSFLLNSPDKLAQKRLAAKGIGVLGSVTPDNYQAGRVLAQLLHQSLPDELQKTGERSTMLALLGDVATNAAIEREQGLLGYTNRHYGVNLVDRVDAQWSEKNAYDLATGLLQRFPDTRLIWCANDAIARGAARAATELNIRDQVHIGGINWDKGHEKTVDVSLGGHVLLGGYLLTEIRKFHDRKISAIGEQKIAIFRPYSENFRPLYDALHGSGLRDIDFKKFTTGGQSYNIKTLNQQIKF